MKLNTALVISVITLILGLIFSKPNIFIPVSIVIASIIDLYTRKWVASNMIGGMIKTSVLLKGLFAVIGFYAMVGQLICIFLLVKWFIF